MKALNDQELSNVSGGVYTGELMSYTVLPDDTLQSIAMKFNTKQIILQEINFPLIDDSMTVKPGMLIQVPKNNI